MKPKLGRIVLISVILLAPAFVSNTEEAASASASPGGRQVADDAQQAADILSCGLNLSLGGSASSSSSSSQACAPLGADALPGRLVELLDHPGVSDEFRAGAQRSNLSAVSPAHMAAVPLPLLVLIGAGYLTTCTPRSLSAIVRAHPSDVFVAWKVLSSMDLADDEYRTRFVRELGLNSGLSAEVQAAIGQAAVRWWGRDMQHHSMDLAMVGTPLLAALPPGYLAELAPDDAANMLMRFRNHPWDTMNDPKWSQQPSVTKRVWMEMFKKDPASGKAQLHTEASEGLNMLWAGATPDEINDLQFEEEDKYSLTRLGSLTKLQVRSFLGKLFPKAALSSVEFNEVFNWMLDLSPAALQRFLVNDTDFSSLPSADISRASVPTLKQVLQEVVASGVVQGRISNARQPGSWGRNIKDIGRLVYLIRATHLSEFSEQRLPADVLATVDTYRLSAMQARFLTRKGQFVDLRRPLKELEGLHGLTRAIPTGTLVGLRDATVSDAVVQHLLESLPAVNPGRSAVIFNKRRASLHEVQVLEAVLRNPNPGQYFSLLSSRELAGERASLEKTFTQLKSSQKMRFGMTFGELINEHLNKKDKIEDHLHLVPRRALSAILGSARRALAADKQGTAKTVWTADTLLSPDRPLIRGALLGLSCVDVMAMDLVDLPVIMAAFNKRTRDAGLMFPKRVQHCLQRAMEDYLAMKKTLRRFKDDIPLVVVLEPSDITAFGGYILSTLRPQHIRQAQHAELILSTIGSLSPRELLAAVHDVTRLQELALSLVDLHGARRSVGPRSLFALGNLHMFLPADVISAIQADAWKLFVEAHAGEARSLAMCANSEQRDAWHRLHVRAFGSAKSWSAGVLAALGDTLAALPTDTLSTIRTVSWRDAADTLAQRTAFHLETDVPGSDHALTFIEVCRTLLEPEEQSLYYWSVRRVVRYYLRSAQGLLDTVEDADSLVRRLLQRSARTHGMGHPDYRPHSRHSASSTSSSTTTTTTTTSTTSEASTTTTEATSTPDFFENFDDFMNSSPAWLLDMFPSTTEAAMPTEPPKTVIVSGDKPELNMGDADDVTASTATSTTSSTEANVAGDTTSKDEMLIEWDEAQDKLPLPKASSKKTSTTTERIVPMDVSTAPSAVTLPPLPAGSEYQDAEAASEDPLEVSTEAAAEATNSSMNLVRRRRGDDAAELQSELQVGRDVLLQVTCDALQTLGAASSLALVDGDPEHMLDVEAEDCVEVLAHVPMKRHITSDFWAKIPPKERSDLLGDLGHLVSAMSVDEVTQMNLSLANERGLDSISVIAQHVRDQAVLDAVAARVVQQNPNLMQLAGGGASGAGPGAAAAGAVDPESLLVALGPLTCSLPLDLQRLLLTRRGAFLRAAQSLQGVRLLCQAPCLEELARAALTDAALGPLASWTPEDVHDMGVIMAGLSPDQIKQLQRPLSEVEQPLSGMTASAIACMSPAQVQAIGDLLGVLSPAAASAVTPYHRHEMSYGQEAALLRVRNLAFTRVLGRPEPRAPTASSATPVSVHHLLVAATVSFALLFSPSL